MAKAQDPPKCARFYHTGAAAVLLLLMLLQIGELELGDGYPVGLERLANQLALDPDPGKVFPYKRLEGWLSG